MRGSETQFLKEVRWEHYLLLLQVFSFTFGPNEARAAQEVVLLTATRVGKVMCMLCVAACCCV